LRLLLDTHVAIWAISEPERIRSDIVDLMTRPATESFVSVVSLWEIAIKRPLDRKGIGKMPLSAAEALEAFKSASFSTLSVTPHHALAVESLPSLHGDPFDRLLVAQALTEPLRLVTHDAALAAYSDTVILF
jgi:PIN domain nuclease of toxin-antitoxin system